MTHMCPKYDIKQYYIVFNAYLHKKENWNFLRSIEMIHELNNLDQNQITSIHPKNVYIVHMYS